MIPPLLLPLIGAAAAFLVMSGLWAVQRKTGNAGIVDVGWSLTIPVLALGYAAGGGRLICAPVLVMVLLTLLWGTRLAVHIHRRNAGKPEDARYAELRRAWGASAQVKLFVFFQFQAAAALLFSVPVLIVVSGPCGDGLEPNHYAGTVLWMIALAGEHAADRQLAAFKTTASRGSVCDVGLWRYSRHPNYFFEWLIWCAAAVFAWSSPYGYLALICPILMLFFLFRMTGIPATEEQALRSKGDAYRRYQKTTSPFVPWFRRKS